MNERQLVTDEMVKAACDVLFGCHVSESLKMHVREAISAAIKAGSGGENG